jgi:hypothetical protein
LSKSIKFHFILYLHTCLHYMLNERIRIPHFIIIPREHLHQIPSNHPRHFKIRDRSHEGFPRCPKKRVAHVVTAKILCQRGFFEASVKISFTSSIVVSRFAIKVMSTIEPAGTGTRIEIPSKRPVECRKGFGHRNRRAR